MKPVAMAFLAIITLAALACTGGQSTQAPISTPATAPTVEATVIVATEAGATSETPPPTRTTAVDLPAKTPATDPTDVSTPTLTAALVATATPAPSPTVTPVPTPTAELVPTATPRPAAIPTRVPTPTPEPTATAAPTSTPTPTATRSPTPTPTAMPSPTPTPTPKPAPVTDPGLEGYAPLLKEAVTGMDFVRDGLTTEEKNVLDWADNRLFSNPRLPGEQVGAGQLALRNENRLGPSHPTADDGDRHPEQVQWPARDHLGSGQLGPGAGRAGHIPWNVHPLLREVGLRHR